MGLAGYKGVPLLVDKLDMFMWCEVLQMSNCNQDFQDSQDLAPTLGNEACLCFPEGCA